MKDILVEEFLKNNFLERGLSENTLIIWSVFSSILVIVMLSIICKLCKMKDINEGFVMKHQPRIPKIMQQKPVLRQKQNAVIRNVPNMRITQGWDPEPFNKALRNAAGVNDELMDDVIDQMETAEGVDQDQANVFDIEHSLSVDGGCETYTDVLETG